MQALTGLIHSKALLWVFGIFILTFNFTSVPNVLSWDVFGYYLYLPATFIYHDLDLSNRLWLEAIFQNYDISTTPYQLVDITENTRLIRYSLGWAILNLPFFFLGHLCAMLFDFPLDGFSSPYVYCITLGYCLYLIYGVWMLRKGLLVFFNEAVVTWVLLIILAGTNVLHLSGQGVGMTHLYLFALYAQLIYATYRYHEKPDYKFATIIGITLGLLVVVRPSEMIAVFIPLLWNVRGLASLKTRVYHLLTSQRMYLFVVLLLAFLMCLPQLLYWYLLTGKFIFYSYQNPAEGFDFTSPHTLNFLFSFRKGWLLYTPIIILALLGFYQLWIKDRGLFWAFSLFTVLNIYILSSWTNWWYAESFSQRSMAQSYAVLSIPLGYFLSGTQMKKPLYKVGIVLFATLAILLNTFQTWQMIKGVIHPSRMTMEAYLSTFLKLQQPPGFEEMLILDRDEVELRGINEAEYMLVREFGLLNDTASVSEFGSHSPFSESIDISHSEITSRDHAWIRVTGKIMVDCEDCTVLLVTSYENKDGTYQYKTKELYNSSQPLVEWNGFQGDYLTPVPRFETDHFKAYLWISEGTAKVKLKQFTASVFEQTAKGNLRL